MLLRTVPALLFPRKLSLNVGNCQENPCTGGRGAFPRVGASSLELLQFRDMVGLILNVIMLIKPRVSVITKPLRAPGLILAPL